MHRNTPEQPQGTRNSSWWGPNSLSTWVKNLVKHTVSLVWSSLGLSFVWKPATGAMFVSQARSRHGLWTCELRGVPKARISNTRERTKNFRQSQKECLDTAYIPSSSLPCPVLAGHQQNIFSLKSIIVVVLQLFCDWCPLWPFLSHLMALAVPALFSHPAEKVTHLHS